MNDEMEENPAMHFMLQKDFFRLNGFFLDEIMYVVGGNKIQQMLVTILY